MTNFIQKNLRKNSQVMISSLIREIILDEYKIEMIYNYTDSPVGKEPQGGIFYSYMQTILRYDSGTCVAEQTKLEVRLMA